LFKKDFSFMARLRLAKSQRKFIRREKARIRREFLDLKKQRELINELYAKLIKKEKDDDKSNLQSSHK
jgi:hypothetical protein